MVIEATWWIQICLQRKNIPVQSLLQPLAGLNTNSPAISGTLFCNYVSGNFCVCWLTQPHSNLLKSLVAPCRVPNRETDTEVIDVSGVSGTELHWVASQSWLNTDIWEIFPYSMLDVSKLFGVPSVRAFAPFLPQDWNLHIKVKAMEDVWQQRTEKRKRGRKTKGKDREKGKHEGHKNRMRKMKIRGEKKKRKLEFLKLLQTQHRFSLEGFSSGCIWWITLCLKLGLWP